MMMMMKNISPSIIALILVQLSKLVDKRELKEKLKMFARFHKNSNHEHLFQGLLSEFRNSDLLDL